MPSPGPCTFWLIEDHLTFRNAVGAALEAAGLRCTGSFPSCEEALAALPAAAAVSAAAPAPARPPSAPRPASLPASPSPPTAWSTAPAAASASASASASRPTSPRSGSVAAAAAAPDVILLDVGLPGMDGIEGLRRFREAAPGTALLILTVFEDDGKILRGICAGASGYLLKTAPVEEITAAIHDVLAGGSPMNSRIARRVLTMFSQLVPAKKDYGLTAREKGILQLMVDGHIKKEIAALLDVSVHTVNTHMRHIYEKLQVHTGTKAVAKALQERLL